MMFRCRCLVVLALLFRVLIADLSAIESLEQWHGNHANLLQVGKFDDAMRSFLEWYGSFEKAYLAGLEVEDDRITVLNGIPHCFGESNLETSRAELLAYIESLIHLAMLDGERVTMSRVAHSEVDVTQRRLEVLIGWRTDLIVMLCQKISDRLGRDGVAEGWPELTDARHGTMRALAMWSRFLVDRYEPDFTPFIRHVGTSQIPLEPTDVFRLKRKTQIQMSLRKLYWNGFADIGSCLYERQQTEEFVQYMLLAGRHELLGSLDWESAPFWVKPQGPKDIDVP